MAALRRNGADGVLQNAQGSFATAAALETLRTAGAVWDYSASNVPALSRSGVNAKHVPLGFSNAWAPSESLRRIVEAGEIPVLFYGTATPRRTKTLKSLRSGPDAQPIFHANAATDGTFGPALDALILASDVVLVLRAFDGDGPEWKMPRLAKLLAAGSFVIAEGACDDAAAQCAPHRGGAELLLVVLAFATCFKKTTPACQRCKNARTSALRELGRRRYRGGVVFASAEDLKAAVAYYRDRPLARRAIADRGREIFANRTMAANLRGAVEAWLGDGG